MPTPLLIFQIALIVGSLLTGFLLSPFLVLSRNNAQQPAHRVRAPEQKLRNRRYYALGFYVGSVVMVGGLIGLWTRWLLGNRDPWLWAIFYLVEGNNKWSRPALLAYWAFLGLLSVAGWVRQLSRTRKYRIRNQETGILSANAYDITPSPLPPYPDTQVVPQTTGTLPGKTFPLSIPSLPTKTDVSNVANDLMDAAEKRVPTLGLNARRKYFHGLAVIMFIPGVIFDVRFAHTHHKCRLDTDNFT